MRTTFSKYLGLLALLCAPAVSHAQQHQPPAAPPGIDSALTAPLLLGRLRQGGLVLACRHAITDRSKPDAQPIDVTDRSRQRNLSDLGREQAEALGRNVRAAAIPIGEVFSSPMYRARETAETAFGRVVLTSLLWEGQDHRGQFSHLFFSPVTAGANRVLVTHQAMLSAIPGRRQNGVEEGDCYVLAPTADQKVIVLGVLKPSDWRTTEPTETAKPTQGAPHV